VGLSETILRVRARRRGAERAKERRRLSRRRPQTAFVLSGGGILGAVQVGQLAALLEQGITPDLIVATSVGALNAAWLGMTPTREGIGELEAIWRGLRTEDIFPGGRMARTWHIIARGDHIYSNEGIRRLVERLPVRTFESLIVPTWIGAMNLRTGEERWFSSGPLMPALLSSTALPGVFPPVAIDGELYIDGGVVNNVPISKAIELGAKRVYVLTCGTTSNQQRPIRRPLDVLVQAFAHSRATRASIDLERYAGRAEIITLPIFDTGFIRFDDPSQSARLISQAHTLSRAYLTKTPVVQAEA
jgi:NTE family protein